MKHKSPKILREAKQRARGLEKQYGILRLGKFPFTVAGTLTFTQGSGLTVNSPAVTFKADPAITFSSDPDTGMAFSSGDWITISAGQNDDRSNRINHKKVHVARRRQSKGKVKPIMYQIEDVSATTMTIKAGSGLHAGGTLTYSA